MMNSNMKDDLVRTELHTKDLLPYAFSLKTCGIPEEKYTWEKLVTEGKKCHEIMTLSLEQAALNKMKLCVLMHTHCEIIYGGKTKEQSNRGVFSITAFAAAIGMKRNTLQRWYEGFRNINLKLQERENTNFKKREKRGSIEYNEEPKNWIFGLSKKEQTAINDIKNKVNRHHTKAEVSQIFDKQINRSKEDLQLDRYVEQTVTLSNFLCDKALDRLDPENINKITKLVIQCAKHLNVL